MTALTGTLSDQAEQAWRNKNDIWQALRSGQASLEASQAAHPGEDLGDARHELEEADRQYTEIIMTRGESNDQGTVDAWNSAWSHLENFVAFLPAMPSADNSAAADPFANDPDPLDSELGPVTWADVPPDASPEIPPAGGQPSRRETFPPVPIILALGVGLAAWLFAGKRRKR